MTPSRADTSPIPAPQRARPQLRRIDKDFPTGLWLGSLLFLVVMFVRPQDLIPGLSAVRPGLVAAVWLLLAWFAYKQRDYLSDPLPKLFLAFMVLIAGSVIVVANHFWYLICVQDMTMMGIAWFLALPAVLRYRQQRLAFCRWLVASFVFVGAWVMLNGGVGTSSFMSDENDTAGALNTALALCFWASRLDPSRMWRWIGLIGTGLCALGVVLTASRGGFLGLIATVGAIALVSGKLLRAIGIGVVLAVLAIPFLPAGYLDEMATIRNTGDATRSERFYSWNRAIDLFWKSPIIGVGANQYPWRLPEVEVSKEASAERGDNRMVGGRAAHSLYFTLLPETGLVGVGIFFAMVWVAGKRAWAWRNNTDPEERDRKLIALWVFSGGAGFLATSLFISTLYYPWFWLLTALAVTLSTTLERDQDGKLSWPKAASQRGRHRPVGHPVGRPDGRPIG